MKKNHNFPYSDDNKRYHTFNYYLKHHFKQKVFKVPLNAGFTCPNRDGHLAIGGCTFCSAMGSGDYTAQGNLLQQFETGTEMMKQKWPHGKAMAYFQAFTNTYGTLEKIKQCIDPFLQNEDVLAIAIATRADCLEDEKIEYLEACSKQKEIWIELGLQSIHNQTANQINRGHDFECFLDCIQRLSHTHCKICVHLMNGLPNETKEMMIESAKIIGQLPIHAVKIHMLHLIKGSKMANDYLTEPFHILTKEEYIDIVTEQLKVLPKEIIIQRLTGDGVASDLLEPQWTLKKVCVLNDIDKRMASHNITQGMSL